MNSNVIRESEKRKFGEEYVDELSKKLKQEIIDSDHGEEYEFPLYDDDFFSSNQTYIDDVAAAQAACERDPENAQNFKNCGLAFKYLAYGLPYNSKREQFNQDAKSLLEKALKMDATDYETMYELGSIHYSILETDSTLETYGEVYMKLCHDAIEYFKQVQQKAPHIYENKPWLEAINRFLPNVPSEQELQERMSRLESSPSSEWFYKWDKEEERLIKGYKLEMAKLAKEMSIENLWYL